jgi:uncharacterized protein (TIGR03118 family)
MKNELSNNTISGTVNYKKQISVVYIAALALFMASTGCQNNDVFTDPETSYNSTAKIFRSSTNYVQVNLISDVEEYNAQLIDPNLVNAWGIAFGPTGGIWVSAAETNLSTIYGQEGTILRPPVHIPFGTEGGNPTGQVFNPTTSFVIPATGQVSKFIFVTENGTVAAWAGGNNAVTVADRSSAEAVYKGVALVNNNGEWFLYATDFHNGKVDIFDHNFAFVGNNKFADPTIPAGFAPFNIKEIGGSLFVTYAKQLGPDNEDDEAGPGNGYVNSFTTGGILKHRFASQGALNSPWGIEMLKFNNGFAIAPELPLSLQTILIGNFGDGRINAYDGNGMFLGQLESNGSPIEIEGLWALSYPPQQNTSYMEARNRIYFTAGPDEEEHGLFGYIIPTNKKP